MEAKSCHQVEFVDILYTEHHTAREVQEHCQESWKNETEGMSLYEGMLGWVGLYFSYESCV